MGICEIPLSCLAAHAMTLSCNIIILLSLQGIPVQRDDEAISFLEFNTTPQKFIDRIFCRQVPYPRHRVSCRVVRE